MFGRFGEGKMKRFKDNSNGTVTDKKTGLMWTKNANHGQKSWCEAMAFCKNLEFAGHDDWRLPTDKELESLISRYQYGPTLPKNHPFINVKSSYYWSSSTCAYFTNYAWCVGMRSGYVSCCNKPFYGCYVWPVRGGRVGRG
jgi:hypothetical protein